MAEDSPELPEVQQCTGCRRSKPVSDFGIRVKNTANGGKAGERTARCKECVGKEKESRKLREQKKREAEGPPVGRSSFSGTDPDLPKELDVMSFTDFINLLRESDSPIMVTARVDVESAADMVLSPKDRANRVAAVIGEYTLLHWT